MIELATIPKATKSAQIRNYVAANPKAKSVDVAKAIGVTPAYVSTVLWNAKKKAKVVKKAKKVKPKWEQLGLFSSDKSLGQLAYEAGLGMAKSRMEGNRQIEMFEPKADPVNNPAHYIVGGIETIDFIEAKKLGYNLGNVVKYITRADHKANKLQDLRKAQWYLEREIFNVENNKKTA
jgi:hypothetical protein